MAIPTPKPNLITGATGNQGSAVLSHLLALNAASPTSPPFTLYALTRHPTSAAARALAPKSPTIHLIPGNLGNPAAVFAIPEPLWGVYSVQLGIGQTQAAEEQQGKALVDAALAHGARHFVYSSTARLAESRPTGFFENMKPGFQGAVFAGVLRYNLPRGYKLGFISTDDIGWFAAQAFLRPEAPEYRNASRAGRR
ncbi:nucleoside-diphosphate-sugar epimerase family protein [Cenococcum geophilum 1.58]|uniref:nucleoside-diphosphate-sugar epimerase family protein n=1 Tax=Cenococcum geophilum 1.58 TaxID=794803 RepID=UPI00358E427A|nr:nucleoside-diphosphate-sugar epimerase family protein [Cenococcum geophilum 1.58]